jgi:hypothetical protein
MKPKKDNDWAVLLEQSLRSREKRPDGHDWSTRDEMQGITKLGSSACKEFLRRAVSIGAVEMFRGTQMVDGKLANQTWYRIKKGAK